MEPSAEQRQFAGHGGEMVSSDGADVAANVNDFGGGEFGRKRGDDFSASHRELHIAEA